MEKKIELPSSMEEMWQLFEDKIEAMAIESYEQFGVLEDLDPGFTIQTVVGPFKIVAIPLNRKTLGERLVVDWISKD